MANLKTTVKQVRRLACAFKADVEIRRAAGDKHAEYHARDIKIRAHKLLLDIGVPAREVVRRFNKLSRGC